MAVLGRAFQWATQSKQEEAGPAVSRGEANTTNAEETEAWSEVVPCDRPCEEGVFLKG